MNRKLLAYLVVISVLVVSGLSVAILYGRTADKPDKPILMMTPSELFQNPNLRQLAMAAQRGDVDKISTLIHQGVDVNGKGKYGVTPLFSAWQVRNKRGYKALLEHGANPNVVETGGYTLLNEIAQSEDPYFMKLALTHGANPNLVEPRSGETPMFVAAANPYGKANVPLLIKAGADLNHQDNDGQTPLMGAAGSNQYDVVYELLKAGANYRLKNKWGNTVKWDISNSEQNMAKSGAAGVWLEKVIDFLKTKGFISPDTQGTGDV